MKNIYVKLAEALQENSGFVLATVTGTEGSTPQKPGSSAWLDGSTLIAGTVGGGSVEGKVQRYAGICSASKKSAYLSYDMDSDETEGDCPICGGTITMLIDADPLKSHQVFKELGKSLASGTPGVLITGITAADELDVTINRYWATGVADPLLPGQFKEILTHEVRNILSSPSNKSYRQLDLPVPGEKQTARFFLEPVFPLPRLVIAGAGHVGRALSIIGKMLDFEVIVIDDREEFANPDNLPAADQIICKNITDAIREIRKDTNTYIVIVTRGHRDDAIALKQCIGSEAGYIGMMGSKTKVAKVHDDFIKNQWATEEQWQKVHTPIGLKIGSVTVEEIAVSIAAQLVLQRSLNMNR